MTAIKGPYRVRNAKWPYPGIEAPGESIIIFGNEDEECGVRGPKDQRLATARLLAASWELAELLREFIAPFATVTDATLAEYPDTPQPAMILKARALLARIEGK